MPRTLAQRRAGHALAAIRALPADPAIAAPYLAAIKGLPVLIRTNGLGQAMAMMLSQRGRETAGGSARGQAFGTIYQQMRAWLGGDEAAAALPGGDLIAALCAADQRHYLAVQAEAMLYAEWLKKFANAFIAGDDAGRG